jgi:hypothetical protein
MPWQHLTLTGTPEEAGKLRAGHHFAPSGSEFCLVGHHDYFSPPRLKGACKHMPYIEHKYINTNIYVCIRCVCIYLHVRSYLSNASYEYVCMLAVDNHRHRPTQALFSNVINHGWLTCQHVGRPLAIHLLKYLPRIVFLRQHTGAVSSGRGTATTAKTCTCAGRRDSPEAIAWAQGQP